MLCLLPALSLCSWCVVLEYALISRFKGVFRGFCGACVGLCCSGTLRGLCGFCTRVELGGLKACGVFAPIFIFFAYVFALRFISLLLLYVLLSFFALVVFCLSSCIVFVALWVCWVFLFPYGLYAKRKGAKCFPCVLACLVVGCFIWLRLFVDY